jgi:hypothetical protein
MVYNTQDQWVLGLCPSSGFLKNTTFLKLDLLASSCEGLDEALLGLLGRANFHHWTQQSVSHPLT